MFGAWNPAFGEMFPMRIVLMIFSNLATYMSLCSGLEEYFEPDR